MQTPLQLGYHFPAEWEKHEATWLTWPYLDDSFPGILENIYPFFLKFIKEISKWEKVRINIPNQTEKERFYKKLSEHSVTIEQVETYLFPTNDVWCRDHGPAFLVNSAAHKKKIIVNWNFNAWGGKYPSDLDNQIPEKIASAFGYPLFSPGIVMEGGSVDMNGNGTVLTTSSCLLNPNRNPQLTQIQIETFLYDYYGLEQVLWLGDGIAGDDTDGHIDDITRFVNEDTVVTAIETNESDENFKPLQENMDQLKRFRLLNGKQLNVVELPMPKPVYSNGERLPASYANFYITNRSVIVPQFNCVQDDPALEILAALFPDREVVGIDSSGIIRGLGSFHCLSQQEPFV